ncbi:phosphohydrolase [Candidatus Woesebacteria bacterium]|nr:phosphohydrolase [Candidatus Woesebacteria bacterium]
MDRKQALKLLHDNMTNQNLRRHCYAVEAAMLGLYDRLVDGEVDEKEKEAWGVAGLIHDADYEATKDEKDKVHTKEVGKWLEELDARVDVRDAVARHGWTYIEDAPKPDSKMDWALYCCDELTGLIVAVALVKEDKRLASVTVDSVMNKWNSKSFAAGVDRKQIEKCEQYLNIPLREFVGVVLLSMQNIHDDLGL